MGTGHSWPFLCRSLDMFLQNMYRWITMPVPIRNLTHHYYTQHTYWEHSDRSISKRTNNCRMHLSILDITSSNAPASSTRSSSGYFLKCNASHRFRRECEMLISITQCTDNAPITFNSMGPFGDVDLCLYRNEWMKMDTNKTVTRTVARNTHVHQTQ